MNSNANSGQPKKHSAIQGSAIGLFRPAYAYYVIVVLLLAYTLSFADRMLMTLLIEPIKKEFGISDTAVSILVGFAFALFYVVMGIPFGYLSDRLNRRNMIRLGIGAWSLMMAICGLASTFGTLFLGRMGVGVGEATLSPCAYSMLGDYFPRDKLGRAMALYSLGIPLGTGCALVFGGIVVQSFAKTPVVIVPFVGSLTSWRAAFLVLALPGLLLMLLMSTVREPLRRGAKWQSERAPDAFEVLRFVKLNKRVLAYYFGGISILSMVVYGTMAWIPTFFARTYALNAARAGVYYGTILAVAGTVGLFAGGLMGDRLVKRGASDGHLRTLMFGIAGASPFFISIPLMPNMLSALLLLIPATILWSVALSLAGTIVQLLSPPNLRGQMTAIYFLVSVISGPGIGTTLVAVLTDFVFKHPSALRWSLAMVALALPLAVLLFALALKPYRDACDSLSQAAAVTPG